MPLSFIQSLLGETQIPEVNYNFVVFMGLDIFGTFQGVEGIGLSVDPYEYNEGGRNWAPRRLPFDKPLRPTDVTLKWGTPMWGTLYEWMNDVEVGKAFRREVIIAQLGRAGWPTRLFFLTGAWPIDWKAAELSTSGSEWAMESLTLAVDRVNVILTPIAQVMSLAGSDASAGSVTGGAMSGG